MRMQVFAQQHLSASARKLYWRRLLHDYTELWPDMEDFVRKQVG